MRILLLGPEDIENRELWYSGLRRIIERFGHELFLWDTLPDVAKDLKIARGKWGLENEKTRRHCWGDVVYQLHRAMRGDNRHMRSRAPIDLIITSEPQSDARTYFLLGLAYSSMVPIILLGYEEGEDFVLGWADEICSSVPELIELLKKYKRKVELHGPSDEEED